jgi:hypothetical protein
MIAEVQAGPCTGTAAADRRDHRKAASYNFDFASLFDMLIVGHFEI